MFVLGRSFPIMLPLCNPVIPPLTVSCFQQMWHRDANVTSWCSHNEMQTFTYVILYMNIICIAQWLFVGDSEILHFSDIFARHQKLCKPESIFKQSYVNFFYYENMTSFLNYVKTMLRALFAWHSSCINFMWMGLLNLMTCWFLNDKFFVILCCRN